jgi:hypothetical protein
LGYVLQGVNCSLEISNIKIYEDAPSDALCWVSVVSGNFCGATEFDIDISELGEFSVQLQNMYETLHGSAQLKESYCPSFIKVDATSGGHYNVSGSINLSYPHHLLEFEFDIDQTMLRDFAKKLCNNLSHFVK